MVDEPSSLGEAEMLGTGSIEHRELIYYTVSKSTTFEPPRSGPGRPRGYVLPAPRVADVRGPRVTLRFGCNTTIRRVHRLHAPRRGVLGTFHM